MKCGWLYFFMMFHEAAVPAGTPSLVPTISHIRLHIFLLFDTDLPWDQHAGPKGRWGRSIHKEGHSDPLNVIFQTISSRRLHFHWILAIFGTYIFCSIPHHPCQYQGQRSRSHRHLFVFFVFSSPFLHFYGSKCGFPPMLISLMCPCIISVIMKVRGQV